MNPRLYRALVTVTAFGMIAFVALVTVAISLTIILWLLGTFIFTV